SEKPGQLLLLDWISMQRLGAFGEPTIKPAHNALLREVPRQQRPMGEEPPFSRLFLYQRTGLGR
ncbi:MAG: hypothetical protein RBT34_10340, partial [Anaerolineaceae bacterium]|nr:hypothetical protein [Anaerolineaceae bacterium]